MKTRIRLFAAFLLVLSLTCSCALADSITFTGTVAAGGTVEVYAPIGGTVDRVYAEAGQKVAADDVIASLKTTKVYAEEAGTVTGVFGRPGDAADSVSQRYGGVVYIEGESIFSVSASTENAYNSTETKLVHVGESVFLSAYSDSRRTGSGVITAIQGTDYTVRVLSGDFVVGESVNIFRGDSAVSVKRIGRGTLGRVSPTAVTGSGSIVSFAVSAGDRVERGDVLFETLDGSFDGLYMSGSEIFAGVNGTISQVNVQQGNQAQKNSIVAVIYPENAMRVEAQVEESDLAYIAVGDPVSIELLWNQDEGVTYSGVISMISAIAANSQDGTVTYTVYIDFTPDGDTRYGMSAVVTTIDPEDEAPVGDDDEPAAEEAPENQRGDRPEGFEFGDMPEGFMPGDMPEGFFFPEEGMTNERP